MAFWPPPGETSHALAVATTDLMRTMAESCLGVSPAEEAILKLQRRPEPKGPERRCSLTKCYCNLEDPLLQPPCYSCIFHLSSPPPPYSGPPYTDPPRRRRSSLSESNILDGSSLETLENQNSPKIKIKKVKLRPVKSAPRRKRSISLTLDDDFEVLRMRKHLEEIKLKRELLLKIKMEELNPMKFRERLDSSSGL